MGTDKLLTAVQRARGPGPAPSLPPVVEGDAREGADLSSLFYLFIYNLPSFL